jgi:hypothetical protein
MIYKIEQSMSNGGITLSIYKLHSIFWSKVDKISISVQVFSQELITDFKFPVSEFLYIIHVLIK